MPMKLWEPRGGLPGPASGSWGMLPGGDKIQAEFVMRLDKTQAETHQWGKRESTEG